MVEKKSNLSLLTTFIGAAVNVALNFYLIPKFGVNGAAAATFASYLVVFLIRAVNTRQFIKIRIQPFKLFLNTAILVGQTALLLANVKNWVLWCSLLFVVLILLNIGALLQSARKIFARRQANRPAI